MPAYASVIHPGGAPEWAVTSWIRYLRLKKVTGARAEELKAHPLPILDLMKHDLEQVIRKETSVDDAIAESLDVLEPKDDSGLIASVEPYVG